MPRTLGYHYVKSGYGLWLPGDDRGSWSQAWDEQIGFAEPHTLNRGDRPMRVIIPMVARRDKIQPTGQIWFDTSKGTICVEANPPNRIHSSHCKAGDAIAGLSSTRKLIKCPSAEPTCTSANGRTDGGADNAKASTSVWRMIVSPRRVTGG